jgi:hypothetical protein
MVKIGDLGVTKLLQENADFAQTMVGMPFYLSPELCQYEKKEEKRIAPTPNLLNAVETPSAHRIIIKSKGFSIDDR